jgi:hypothetical protein
MPYRWEAASKLEIHRERPAKRYLVTSLGGYFPVLQQLLNGTLAVVARDGDFHLGQRGRLILVTSPDGGESWSMPTVVAGEGPDDRNPAFGQAADGTLLVAFMKADSYVNNGYAPDSTTEQRARPLFLTRSAGAGWSEPEALPVPPGHWSPFGKIVRLPDDTLLMNVYGRRILGDRLEADDGSFLLRSRDHGQTWDDWSAIATGGFNETALLDLPSGRLLAALRHAAGPAGDDVWTAHSDDGGYTWSDPQRVTAHREHPADLLLLRNGKILLTYGERNPPYGVRALVSHDDGESWDTEHKLTLVSEGTTSDCGYPSSVQLADGSILTAYYIYESLGPFQAVPNQRMGIHAAVVKYHEADLPSGGSSLD